MQSVPGLTSYNFTVSPRSLPSMPVEECILEGHEPRYLKMILGAHQCVPRRLNSNVVPIVSAIGIGNKRPVAIFRLASTTLETRCLEFSLKLVCRGPE
jgi:hypothetical protein